MGLNGPCNERLIGRRQRDVRKGRLCSGHTRRIIPTAPELVTKPAGMISFGVPGQQPNLPATGWAVGPASQRPQLRRRNPPASPANLPVGTARTIGAARRSCRRGRPEARPEERLDPATLRSYPSRMAMPKGTAMIISATSAVMTVKRAMPRWFLCPLTSIPPEVPRAAAPPTGLLALRSGPADRTT